MLARLLRSSLILALAVPALAILAFGQRAPASVSLQAGEPTLPGPASRNPGSPASFPSTTPGLVEIQPLPLVSGGNASLPFPTPGPLNLRVGAEMEVEDLRNEVEHILASTGNRGGKWSVLAVSLDRGDTLLSMNPREPMVPASNMKVFTTAAALHSLGPDFRYTTFLLTTGEEKDSLLRGDLILYGTGDPTFSDRFFPDRTAALDSLAGMIRRRGIQEIHGDLIIDGSYFQGPEIHPEWDPRDLNDHFAAPVAAVGFNENLVRVQVVANRMVGLPPEIRLTPPAAGVPILNIARTVPAGSRSRIWLFRDSPWDPIGIEGEIPLGGRDVWRELPVPDPLVFTGRVLRAALEENGVRVMGDLRVLRSPLASALIPSLTADAGAEKGPRILAVHESPPLLEVLTVVNKKSNNLLAETVARTLGKLTRGDGSFQGGMAAVEEFLTSAVGVSPDEISVRDGSGLSDQNRASAGALVQVLSFMVDSPHWEDFWSTLPEAGVRQELRRMGGSPASRNLRGKTGTMAGVSALSGVVRTRSGERVLFSILSNQVQSEYRAKRAEDQLGIRLASLSRALTPTIQ